jgi:hypothetical protein
MTSTLVSPADAEQALQLSARIKPMLAGHHPGMQGAALAELFSIFLAGHHPAQREQVLQDWLAAVRQLVPVSEAEIFHHGKPPGR